jgi:hypothetical protein
MTRFLCLLNIHIPRRFTQTTGNGVNRTTRLYRGCACGRHMECIGTARVEPLSGRSLTKRRAF